MHARRNGGPGGASPAEPGRARGAADRRARFPLFSSAVDAPRSRRPTDVLLLGLGLVGIVALTVAAPGPTDLDETITALLQSLPGLAGWFWRFAYAALTLWLVVLVAMALLVRGRRRLLGDYALSLGLAGGLGLALSRVAGTPWDEGVRALLSPGPPPVYLAIRVASLTAVVVTASPHLSRPLRYVGRTIITVGALAGVTLGVALPIGTAAGFALGLCAAALTHLVLGSPGGRPSTAQVAAGLADLGLQAEEVRDAPLRISGSATFHARVTGHGDVAITAYGRDAWDGQLLTSVWTSLAQVGASPDLGATRLSRAEHEALAGLMAQRAGVPVLGALAVGRTDDDDVLVVTPAPATSLADDPDRWGSDELAAAWRALAALHAAGFAHGSLSAASIARTAEGGVALAGLHAAVLAASAQDRAVDDVRLLVATALALGPDEAVELAATVRGADRLAELLPVVQPPALDADARRAVKRAGWSVDSLRATVAARTGVEPPELERLRRVTGGSLVRLVLVTALAYWLIVSLSQADWSSVWAAFQSADPTWVVAALAMSPLVQVGFSIGTMGAAPRGVRYVPVLMLEYAIQFIALILPATAARVALQVRFYQRFGLQAAPAMSIGVIDSFMGFVVQVTLLVVIGATGLAAVTPPATGTSSTASSSGSSDSSVLAIAVLLVAIGLAITLLVPAVRRPALRRLAGYREALGSQLRAAAGTLTVLRSPARVGLMLGGNFMAQVLQAIILGLCLAAFGQSADLAQLIVVNTFVSLFAGMMPVPGGMGVAEAGLTAGLQALGVPSSVAVSTAILFRLVTFYLPPLWGAAAMRWLRRGEYV